MQQNLFKGHLACFGANCIWGVMAPVAKMVMAAGVVTPLLMSSFRMFGAALLFFVASLMLPREKVPVRDLLRLAGAAMLGIVLNQGCYIFGVSLTSPGEGAVITTTMPIWVMLLAWMLLGEPITWLKTGGIVLGACGALTLVFSGQSGNGTLASNPALGDLLILGAQLSYASYLTFYKNFIRKYSVVTLMKWMFTFASVAVLPFAVKEASQTQWSAVNISEMWGIGYVVVAGTFLAYICVMIGQKTLRPTLVGMYNYVQPVSALAVSISLGLDTLTFLKGFAILLIFSGVFLVNLSKSRQPTAAVSR